MAGLFSRRLSGKGDGRASASGGTAVSTVRSSKQHEARLGELLGSLEESGLGWFWETDSTGQLTYLTAPALDAIGCEEHEVIGRDLTEVLETDDTPGQDTSRPLKFRLSSRSPISRLNVKVSASSKDVWWEVSAVPRLNSRGDFLGYHGIARDVSSTLADARQAEHAAQYDSLTGLANRARMTHQLDHVLTTFKQAKRSCAIMMMDLDRFKQVNDTMGHPAGDELLVQVADRVRRIFGQRGEIGRLGGDEFQIILPDLDDRGQLGDLANQLVQMVSQPYSIAGNRAIIGCSVGIAVAPYDGIEADELVKAADLALYSAKDNGRGNYKFFSADLSAQADFRKRIEDDLRRRNR